MASSRASIEACVMNCSTRPCSRRLIRRAWPWQHGVQITITLVPTHNLGGGRQPRSPRRSRVWGRRCATPQPPRRPRPLHPPSRANPTARTNFRVDKSWGQGQSGRRRLVLAGTRTIRIIQWSVLGGQAKKSSEFVAATFVDTIAIRCSAIKVGTTKP